MTKKIVLIHTGGTISMSIDNSGSVKPLGENPLIMETKKITNMGDLIIEEPFHLPSPHITITEMIEIKNIIDKYKEKEIDGIVITHGTDTLEETAYFLDLTVKTSIPVVITGAMRSSNEVGSEGLYNLISSIRVASCEESKNKGVLVVLNDEIHAARYVTKAHTSNLSTFKSPQFGPLGIVTNNGVHFEFSLIKHEHYKITDISKRVALLKAHAGMDSLLFHAIKNHDYNGVVIEGLGKGNLPPSTIDGLTSILNEQIPVVLVSRCYSGKTDAIYSYEGGGKHLKKLGVIFSNNLNGQKARIKLLIALSVTNDNKKIEEIFQ